MTDTHANSEAGRSGRVTAPSLRDRIAEAIATRDPLEDWCGKPINWADISEGHRECYRRDADAILAIPGIAVVELPEPDYEDPTGHGWNGDPAGGVYAHGGKVYDEESSHTPAQAKAVAANWLAAAAYAERDQ